MKLFVFFGLLVVIGNLLCIQSVDVKFDPCCSFPCQNSGVCLSHGWDHFQCDCTGLDYYGELCQTRITNIAEIHFLKNVLMQ